MIFLDCQLPGIVFQTLNMLDGFVATYNFPLSLHSYAFKGRKNTSGIVDTLAARQCVSIYISPKRH